MQSHLIFGVHVTDRTKQAGKVQELLSQFGCNIKTRVGLHHVDEATCSPSGVILLEMFGDEALCRELGAKLRALPGVDVQQMEFAH
jgi:hypothetical protein